MARKQMNPNSLANLRPFPKLPNGWSQGKMHISLPTHLFDWFKSLSRDQRARLLEKVRNSLP
jgi:uncharacterized protein (DUF3820 family)